MPLIENVKQYTLSDLRWLAAQDVTPEAKEMLQDEIKRREASHGNPIFGGSTSTPPDLKPYLTITIERPWPELQEMRDLLAGAASLLKEKLTPDTGQLRTQWDRDVDEWLIAATPLFEEEER